MKKLQLGKITICSVGRIRKKLKEQEGNQHQKDLRMYLKGVADSHWFGICVYRNNI